MVQALKLALSLGKQSAVAHCKAGWGRLLEYPTACTLSRHPCLPPYVPPIPLHLHEYAAACSDKKEHCVSLWVMIIHKGVRNHVDILPTHLGMPETGHMSC